MLFLFCPSSVRHAFLIIDHYENTPIQIHCKCYRWKYENIKMKNCDIFLIFAQNIDLGYSLEPPRWGGSNEYPQSMFSTRNKKNNVYPYKPQFYYIKVGFKKHHFISWMSVCCINMISIWQVSRRIYHCYIILYFAYFVLSNNCNNKYQN